MGFSKLSSLYLIKNSLPWFKGVKLLGYVMVCVGNKRNHLCIKFDAIKWYQFISTGVLVYQPVSRFEGIDCNIWIFWGTNCDIKIVALRPSASLSLASMDNSALSSNFSTKHYIRPTQALPVPLGAIGVGIKILWSSIFSPLNLMNHCYPRLPVKKPLLFSRWFESAINMVDFMIFNVLYNVKHYH